MSNLVLASQSVQRAELLSTLTSDFIVAPADIDELAIDHADHQQRAQMVAEAKAAEVIKQYPEAWILAADTFVVFDRQRWEKPLNVDEASEMLSRFSGKMVEVFTGVCWLHQNQREGGTVTSKVAFRELSKVEITNYIADRPVTAWAGGFSIKETAGLSLLSSISGSITAVAGLPLEWVKPRLIAAGLIGKIE